MPNKNKDVVISATEEAAAEVFFDKRREWEADIPSEKKWAQMNNAYLLMWTVARKWADGNESQAQHRVNSMLKHINLYREDTR